MTGFAHCGRGPLTSDPSSMSLNELLEWNGHLLLHRAGGVDVAGDAVQLSRGEGRGGEGKGGEG